MCRDGMGQTMHHKMQDAGQAWYNLAQKSAKNSEYGVTILDQMFALKLAQNERYSG